MKKLLICLIGGIVLSSHAFAQNGQPTIREGNVQDSSGVNENSANGDNHTLNITNRSNKVIMVTVNNRDCMKYSGPLLIGPGKLDRFTLEDEKDFFNGCTKKSKNADIDLGEYKIHLFVEKHPTIPNKVYWTIPDFGVIAGNEDLSIEYHDTGIVVPWAD